MNGDQKLYEGDSKIISPTQALYQTQLSGIMDKRIYSMPLLGQHVGVNRYACEGYNFLSIITDGLLNPRNNLDASGSGGEYNGLCQIIFDDGEVFYINQEIRNIPLVARIQRKGKSKSFKRYFRWYNTFGEVPGATRDIEAGFGNLYFILTKYPYTEHIIKHNPYFCFEKAIDATSAENYWVGVNRPNATYSTVLAYLPMGYKELRYMSWFNATSASVVLREYWTCLDAYQTLLSVTAAQQTCSAVVHSNRYLLVLTNNDGAQKTFRVQFMWVCKTNNLISY